MSDVASVETSMAEKAVEALLSGLGIRGADTLPVLRRIAERVPDVARESDAFARVRLRSMNAESDLLSEEGGAVADAAFARLLGVRSRQTVHNYREAGKVLAFQRGTRNVVYPVWQIYRQALLPGLAEILASLGDTNISSAGKALFFLTPAEALGGERPLDLLRRGEVPEVLVHAQRYGVIGS